MPLINDFPLQNPFEFPSQLATGGLVPVLIGQRGPPGNFEPSADADNALQLGSDGKPYVAAAPPGASAFEPSADADNALQLGSDGKPYVPLSQLAPAPLRPELRTTATHVQWRVEGDALWIDLFPLPESGPALPPGQYGIFALQNDAIFSLQ